MAKLLVLNNGESIEFTNASTPTKLSTVVNSYTAVEEIRGKLTRENLEGATFDGVELHDFMPISSNATALAAGNVSVTFKNTLEANAQIEELKKENAQLKTANAELVRENEALADKAEAADILLGNEEV